MYSRTMKLSPFIWVGHNSLETVKFYKTLGFVLCNEVLVEKEQVELFKMPAGHVLYVKWYLMRTFDLE